MQLFRSGLVEDDRPDYLDAPLFGFQGAVFDGVGRQFMQRERHGLDTRQGER